ncbi:protein draper isoform X5 [Musca domestica]|uniref:Protein draper isoform X5 n=1 Tax=Musca domestica TaxID=7370 RepID=A0ABM3V9F5_MUSDO|nr:protein draper isoform X5 [Musca domestica]
MAHPRILLFYSSCLLVLAYARTELLFDQENRKDLNVCKTKVTYPVTVVTTELQNYQVRTNNWCFNVPPRCSSYKLQTRVVNKTTTLYKERFDIDCCEGYMRNPVDDTCIPKCDEKCVHGVCVAPNKCKCEHGYGGPSCDIICRCKNNSSCDPDTGRCICAAGWTGEDCSKPCEEGSYGNGCKEKCPTIVHGNKSCDHITGEIRCRDGYIGLTCEHPCPTGYYGPGCTKKCNCYHGGECNHITGVCQCMPGWTGQSCNMTCPDGYYGQNCSQECHCQNDNGCRKNDGLCLCKPGWMGTRCDEVCPEGFYGEHCMRSCQCASPNFVCQATDGCVCRKGFTGPNCDLTKAEQHIQEAERDTGRAGLAWGLSLAILFVAIIIAVIFYYRRRVSNLKTEIAHVQYISDPTQGWPDRHNFDNPVYGMQANNSETRLLNNLRPKINNLNCGGDMYADDSNASSRAGTYSINYNHDMFAKNFNADLTNPTVYNSLEGLKEEHVYDEIKQKEGYKDPVKNYNKTLFPEGKKINIMSSSSFNHNTSPLPPFLNAWPYEYDHLDYSRPSTSQKPHYHRMNDSMLNINRDEEKPSNLKTMEVLLKKCLPPDVGGGGDETENEDNNAVCSASIADDNNDNASTASPSTSSKQIK